MMIPPFACLYGLATRASWRAAVDSDLVLLDPSSARLWLLDFWSGSVRNGPRRVVGGSLGIRLDSARS